VVIVALAAFAMTLIWARRPGHPDRMTAVYAATFTSVLVAAITIVAVAAGWWQGTFFAIPLMVAAAIDLPLSIAGYTLWLGGYRWLAGKTRHAFLIYIVVVLAFILVVLLVDPIQMQRNQFTLGNGYTVVTDALVGQVVMLSPVLAYEAIRHWRHRINLERT
jgi:hypothetical protein